MSEITVAKARFKPIKPKEAPFDVQFNPASLAITVSNTLEEKGQGSQTTQYVTKSSAKLTMDLIFDTTHTGEDVRNKTRLIAKLMEPIPRAGKRVPSVVLFEWGTFTFQGLIEQYKETIDFFAPEGVPLRATCNVTLSRQDFAFDKDKRDASAKAGESGSEPLVVPPLAQSVTDVASQGGAPDASRQVAAMSGIENPRFPTGPLVIDASVSLAGPVAFASGSASLGVGGGAGLGLSGGVGIGLGASAGIGVGAAGGVSLGGAAAGVAAGGLAAAARAAAGVSARASGLAGQLSGAAVFGSRASAGLSATAGAFAGLLPRTRPASTVDVERLRPRAESATVATDRGASFSLGGRASVDGSAGLSADVGARAGARIRFGE